MKNYSHSIWNLIVEGKFPWMLQHGAIKVIANFPAKSGHMIIIRLMNGDNLGIAIGDLNDFANKVEVKSAKQEIQEISEHSKLIRKTAEEIAGIMDKPCQNWRLN